MGTPSPEVTGLICRVPSAEFSQTPEDRNSPISIQRSATFNNVSIPVRSKRFLDVVNKVKHYSGIEGNVTSQNSLAQLVNSGRKALFDIFAFEKNKRQDL